MTYIITVATRDEYGRDIDVRQARVDDLDDGVFYLLKWRVDDNPDSAAAKGDGDDSKALE